MPPVLEGLLLPMRFDPAGLHADLARIAESEWVPHYNERDYGGEWRGVALRAQGGVAGNLGAAPPGPADWRDTGPLSRCPAFQEVLAAFPCPLRSVRLLRLAPGSFIREHCDNALAFEDGEVRIHVPVQTNPGVGFYLCGERLELAEGHAYYINVNLPHRVRNRGSADRVHLVIDARVDDWVRALFARCVQNASFIPRMASEPGAVAFQDEILRHRELRSFEDRHLFARAAVEAGRAAGFGFDEGDVDAMARAKPFVAGGDTAGWLPVRVEVRADQPVAEWIYAPDCAFTEPFFEDTVRRLTRNPFTAFSRRRMPLREAERTSLAGMIFHLSRCGSTLVAASLGAVPRLRSVSEAAPVDDILQAGRLECSHPECLRSVVAALGAGRPLVLKLDSWHALRLPLLRQAFPDVPWVFVYRDPVEVLVSHLRQPGMQMIPGAMDPRAVGLRPEDVTALTRAQWSARVLGNLMRAALGFRDDPKGLFVNYTELPRAITGRIAPHFGLALTPEEETLVNEAARRDAKNPDRPFVPDTERKQEQGAALREDADVRELGELFGELTRA